MMQHCSAFLNGTERKPRQHNEIILTFYYSLKAGQGHLHYRRDVTLAEDACQVRKGTTPHVLAVLNSFMLALFDFCGVTNAKQYMRCLDAQPLLAVQLLLKPLVEN